MISFRSATPGTKRRLKRVTNSRGVAHKSWIARRSSHALGFQPKQTAQQQASVLQIA